MKPTSCATLIRSAFAYVPTSSQNEVINSLSLFLDEAPPHSIYILRGYAGTGKSSLLGAVVKALRQQRRMYRLLAPTGRAAKVLQNYCQAPAQTIHKEIYRQQNQDPQAEEAFKVGNNRDRRGTVYIVDEASMISNQSEGFNPFGSGQLLDDLLEYCMGVRDAQVVFVGDDAQLPPVSSEYSPAMDPNYLAQYGYPLYQGALLDVVRQEASGEIVGLSVKLRALLQEMQSNGGVWQAPLLPTPTGQEVHVISGYDFPSTLESSYRKVGREETLVITRSNREAEQLNREIRFRSLFYEEPIARGEYLMVCRNNYLHIPFDETDRPTSAFIANGEVLKVLHCSAPHERYGFHFCKAELQDPDGGYVSAQLLLDTLNSGVASLTSEQRQALYQAVMTSYTDVNNKRKLFKALREDPYLNALQVKYACAMTCHKSQGGQWRHVYISLPFLRPEVVDEQFIRWLYTAMTRATEKLYFISPPNLLFSSAEESF